MILRLKEEIARNSACLIRAACSIAAKSCSSGNSMEAREKPA
jgi:hypothetical protein